MFPPPAPIPEPPTQEAGPSGLRWGLLWTLIFAGNLCLPLALGVRWTSIRGGEIGMLAAVAVLYAISLVLCLRGGELRPVLLVGAKWVFFGQFVPILQFAAGMAAILISNRIEWPGKDSFGAEVRGFAVTMMTGVLLGGAAFVFGGGLFRFRPTPRTEQVEDYG